jgi:ribosomal protein S18 acetylase RimI-like enzyme
LTDRPEDCSDLLLRRGTAADALAVTDLVRRAYSPWIGLIGCDPVPMTVDYADALARRRFDLLVSGDEIVALIETEVRPDDLLILNVAVDPALQGRGLGRRLLAHADALAVAAGRDAVRLYTHELYARNIRIYEQAGYAVERLEPFKGALAVHMLKGLAPD